MKIQYLHLIFLFYFSVVVSLTENVSVRVSLLLPKEIGSVAKNLASLKNQCNPSQLGKLIKYHHLEKWYLKVEIIVSNCGNSIFAPEPTYSKTYEIELDNLSENKS